MALTVIDQSFLKLTHYFIFHIFALANISITFSLKDILYGSTKNTDNLAKKLIMSSIFEKWSQNWVFCEIAQDIIKFRWCTQECAK